MADKFHTRARDLGFWETSRTATERHVQISGPIVWLRAVKSHLLPQRRLNRPGPLRHRSFRWLPRALRSCIAGHCPEIFEYRLLGLGLTYIEAMARKVLSRPKESLS